MPLGCMNSGHDEDEDEAVVDHPHTSSSRPLARTSSLPPEPPLHETRSDREARLEYERIGRNPNDQTGKELAYGAMAKRTAAVCCFIFLGGWLIKLGDDLYSWATGQPKGAATGHDNHEGLADFSSSYISSLLKASGQDLSKADESDICETVIDRYYGKYKIFDTEGEELRQHARNLRNLQHKDISARDYRKVSGERLVFWVQLSLAAFVSILGFTRGIVGDKKDTREQIAVIGWIEAGAALLTILIAQWVHKATTVDAEAAAVLRRIRKWGIEYTNNKLKNSSGPNGTRIEELQPLENALHGYRYKTLAVSNLDNSLLESVARLRTKISNTPTSTVQVHQQFQQHLAAQGTPSAPKAVSANSMEAIEELSLLYDCPILVVSETAFEDSTYCRVINQKAPRDAEEKSAEEDPVKYQKEREARAMILYNSEPGFYRAVSSPLDPISNAKRSFATIVAELKTLQPAPPRVSEVAMRDTRYSSATL